MTEPARGSSSPSAPHDAAPREPRRLDVTLVADGFARSRGHARELIEQGRVCLGGVGARRPSSPVVPGQAVQVDAAHPWVGRAAGKLVQAFDAFGPQGLSARDRRCLDVGASTGGFAQVLLRQGAAHVVALDVGHGQLAPRVARDPRVRETSGLNIRDVGAGDLGPPFDVLVADLSFISLLLVLDRLRAQLGATGEAVLLVKPQFEVGRERLGKHGIVRDRADRLVAVRRVVAAAAAAGLWLRDVRACQVQGAGGNQEYLGWFTVRRQDALPVPDVAHVLETVGTIETLETQA